MFREGTPLRAASLVAPGPLPSTPALLADCQRRPRWGASHGQRSRAPPAQPRAALRETPVPPTGLRPADPSPGESGPSLLPPGLRCLPRPSG